MLFHTGRALKTAGAEVEPKAQAATARRLQAVVTARRLHVVAGLQARAKKRELLLALVAQILKELLLQP